MPAQTRLGFRVGEFQIMRLLLAGTAAAVFAFAATPAFAQYGGNPQDQVEGAPAAQAAPEAVEPDDAAFSDPADDQSAMAPDEGAAEDFAAGKPGTDEAGPVDEAQADVDADVDVDAEQGGVDADVDADAAVDQGNVETDVDADADATAGAAANVDADVDADADQDADSEDMAPGEVESDEGYEDQEGEPGDGGVAGGGRS
jgi:hypothetical protein